MSASTAPRPLRTASTAARTIAIACLVAATTACSDRAASDASLDVAANVDGSFTDVASDHPLPPSDSALDVADGNTPAPLRGWHLTPDNTGLHALGMSCDALPLYAGPSKPAAGTTITGQRIDTALDLSAGNIVIERSCIRPASGGGGLPLVTTTDFNRCDNNGCAIADAPVVIRDSEIDGSLLSADDVSHSCAFGGVGTLQRNYVHDMGSGFCFLGTGEHLDVVVEGNYVHRLRAFGDPATTGSHNESLTIRDFETATHPERRCVIRNNRLDSSSGNDTGALFIQTYAGNIDQVAIEGNLLEGNGYQLILEAQNGNIYGMAMRAVDNRFSGTGFGAGYHSGLDYSWSTFTDNYIDDASQPDHRGAPVSEL